MTIFLPPPEFIVELLALKPASLLERCLGKLISRKTITAHLKGDTTPGTRRKLDQFMDKFWPGRRLRMIENRERHLAELCARGEAGAAEVLEGTLTWRMIAEEGVWSADSHERPDLMPSIVVEKLLPLEDASAMATAAWREGNLADVILILERSALAPYAGMDHLREILRGCNDPDQFASLIGPVRAVCALYLLAIFEHEFFPHSENVSGVTILLPVRANEGSIKLPMARLLETLQEASEGRSRTAKLTSFIGEFAGLQTSQLKKLRRWIEEGRFPQISSFRTLIRGFRKSQNLNEIPNELIDQLYYVLRYLTSVCEQLEKAPRTLKHFGGLVNFFAIYSQIHRALGEASAPPAGRSPS